MGIFSFGSSSSSSRQRSESSVDTFIAPEQRGFLVDLLSRTTGALDTASPGGVSTLAGNLGRTGNILLDTLSGLTAGSGGLPGADILRGVGEGASSLLAPDPNLGGSLNLLSEAIGRNTERTLAALDTEASLAGATGGSRQALAAGLIGEEGIRSFERGASDLVRADLTSRRGLLPAVLQAEVQAGTALQQGGIADIVNRIGATEAGIGALPTLMNLGLTSENAAFAPLLAAAEIFGGPTVLQQARSESRGRSKSSGFSIGF